MDRQDIRQDTRSIHKEKREYPAVSEVRHSTKALHCTAQTLNEYTVTTGCDIERAKKRGGVRIFRPDGRVCTSDQRAYWRAIVVWMTVPSCTSGLTCRTRRGWFRLALVDADKTRHIHDTYTTSASSEWT